MNYKISNKSTFACVIYSLLFYVIYEKFIFPSFEYGGFYFKDAHPISIILTIFLIIIPRIFSSPVISKIGQAWSELTFNLAYIPTQIISLIWLNAININSWSAQICLSIGMSIIFYFSKKTIYINKIFTIKTERLHAIFALITAISVLLIIYEYKDSMQIVNFEEVYNLRLGRDTSKNTIIVGYLMSWLSYFFISYYLMRAILEKHTPSILIAFFLSILIYASTGAKSVILLPLISLIITPLLNDKNEFGFLLPSVISTFLIVAIYFLPNDGLLFWLKSIVVMRVLATAGWTFVAYYDFFTRNGLTYYGHIGIINNITGTYKYPYSPGQMIGLEYSGNTDANFNANFWASDGVAAFGVIGIVIASTVVGLLFSIFNGATKKGNIKALLILTTGFMLSILNLPLTTALFSGGGILIYLFGEKLTTRFNK